jgi:predicted phosphodiesterase
VNESSISVPTQVDRIGLFADVHGTYNHVLELRDRYPEVERWFCAGDVVDMFKAIHYNEPSLRVMARLEIPSVMDNHDYRVREQYAHRMGEESRSYLQDLPFSLEVRFGSRRLMIYHATPDSRDDTILENAGRSTFQSAFDPEEADLFVVGHTHSPYRKAVGSTEILNRGALGVDGPSSSLAAMGTLSSKRSIPIESLFWWSNLSARASGTFSGLARRAEGVRCSWRCFRE